MSSWYPIVLAVCLMLAVISQVPAQELVLEDLLDKRWTSEPVSFALEAAAGEFHLDSARLQGPDGPVACQLSEVETWPGTPFVRSAKLWFVTDLAPLERRVYTVQQGPAAATAPPARDDLRVTVTPDSAEFTTSRFGVRLRLGGATYAEPVAASEAPGPILALRLADGTWFGGSDFHGEVPLTAWSAELTAEGPVFGEVRYRFDYADGNRLDLTVRLFAQGDRAQFDAEVYQHSPDNGLRLILSRGLAPLTLHVQKLFWAKRHSLWPEDTSFHKTENIGEWYTLPLRDLAAHSPPGVPPGLVQAVSPWGPWWDDLYAPVVRLGIGDLSRELHVARRDPAAWVKPVGEGSHGTLSELLPLEMSEAGDVYINLRLFAGAIGGVRKFDIAESAPTEAVGWRHRRNAVGQRLGAQVIPYHESLNEVKDYVLEWPQEGSHPRVFLSREELAEIQAAGVQSERIRPLWEAVRQMAIGQVPIDEERWFAPDPWELMTEAERGFFAADVYWFPKIAVYLLKGGPQWAERLNLAGELDEWMGILGDFDKMRLTSKVASLYDAMIDSELISPSQRRIYRAQMAYLAYQMTHPATWSPERGWASGNLNMTVSYAMLGRGIVASALSDHPMAAEWMQEALSVAERLLDTAGPAGEWPESTGYSTVSVSPLVSFAIMAQRAGLADYLNDPRLKRTVMQLAKICTPPDPRRADGRRSNLAYGRDPGMSTPFMGAMARGTQELDPPYSEALRWVWQQTPGAIGVMSDWNMGGFEYAYLQPGLPAAPPSWSTELFPYLGVTFRHGVGSPQEHYGALLSGDMGGFYSSQTGALAMLFAYGTPLGGSFVGNYGYQSEFLVNRVSLARVPDSEDPDYFRRAPFGYTGAGIAHSFVEGPWARFEEQEGRSNVSDFAPLPRQDYTAVDILMKHRDMTANNMPENLPWPALIAGDGQPPVWWRRQALFVKDDDPAGVAYLVLRDTVSGDQPTMWQFWSASDKLGTPAETANREAFLADAPGHSIVAPRELSGDRFTALGPFGVDLEYYIAAPLGTPRHTLRWGLDYRGHLQYQDLLHLQLAGDGAYFVALFPRRVGDPAPEFSTQGNGHIIRVGGTFGADHVFLSARPAEAQAEALSFRGTAASVQDRAGRQVLSLGAAGAVAYGDYALEAEMPVSLRVLADALVVELTPDHQGGTVTLRAPGALRLHQPVAGTTLSAAAAGQWSLTIPAGVTRVVLIPQ